MWFRDAKTNKVLAAQDFLLTNQIISGKAPTFAFRVPSGMTVVPMAHFSSSGTWEGTAVTVK